MKWNGVFFCGKELMVHKSHNRYLFSYRCCSILKIGKKHLTWRRFLFILITVCLWSVWSNFNKSQSIFICFDFDKISFHIKIRCTQILKADRHDGSHHSWNTPEGNDFSSEQRLGYAWNKQGWAKKLPVTEGQKATSCSNGDATWWCWRVKKGSSAEELKPFLLSCLRILNYRQLLHKVGALVQLLILERIQLQTPPPKKTAPLILMSKNETGDSDATPLDKHFVWSILMP